MAVGKLVLGRRSFPIRSASFFAVLEQDKVKFWTFKGYETADQTKRKGPRFDHILSLSGLALPRIHYPSELEDREFRKLKSQFGGVQISRDEDYGVEKIKLQGVKWNPRAQKLDITAGGIAKRFDDHTGKVVERIPFKAEMRCTFNGLSVEGRTKERILEALQRHLRVSEDQLAIEWEDTGIRQFARAKLRSGIWTPEPTISKKRSIPAGKGSEKSSPTSARGDATERSLGTMQIGRLSFGVEYATLEGSKPGPGGERYWTVVIRATDREAVLLLNSLPLAPGAAAPAELAGYKLNTKTLPMDILEHGLWVGDHDHHLEDFVLRIGKWNPRKQTIELELDGKFLLSPRKKERFQIRTRCLCPGHDRS